MSGLFGWDLPADLLPPLTREQRIQAYYLSMAGTYPGPNRAALAAILAHRMVELEDRETTP